MFLNYYFNDFQLGRVCLSHYLPLKKGCKDEGHAKKSKNNRGTEVLRSTMKVNPCHSTVHFEFSLVIP